MAIQTPLTNIIFLALPATAVHRRSRITCSCMEHALEHALHAWPATCPRGQLCVANTPIPVARTYCSVILIVFNVFLICKNVYTSDISSRKGNSESRQAEVSAQRAGGVEQQPTGGGEQTVSMQSGGGAQANEGQMKSGGKRGKRVGREYQRAKLAHSKGRCVGRGRQAEGVGRWQGREAAGSKGIQIFHQ